jgi:hypothetical protein
MCCFAFERAALNQTHEGNRRTHTMGRSIPVRILWYRDRNGRRVGHWTDRPPSEGGTALIWHVAFSAELRMPKNQPIGSPRISKHRDTSLRLSIVSRFGHLSAHPRNVFCVDRASLQGSILNPISEPRPRAFLFPLFRRVRHRPCTPVSCRLDRAQDLSVHLHWLP